MKRHYDSLIIPKIIVIVGVLALSAIFFLFLKPNPAKPVKVKKTQISHELFSQIMERAKPSILELWKEGDIFFPEKGFNCPEEIIHEKKIGKVYYQCNPHFWQCFWQGGVTEEPQIKIKLFDQTFHLKAKASFNSRFYELYKKELPGFPIQYGYLVHMEVVELPEFYQPMLLVDSCRDSFLPERIYGYGISSQPTDEGFVWDNVGRKIFIDKFYVTNRQVNEWRVLLGEKTKVIKDAKQFPLPALLSRNEQKNYCAFYGKRLLEAKLFDAATMPPLDLKNPFPEMFLRPATPWHRDLSKTFLGVARVNPDYQLTPLDCLLAQVRGCEEQLFNTDSVSWMGIHYALGFYPESFENFIEPDKNLKRSSRFFASGSSVHELGRRENWKGEQTQSLPVAFRCYEEVAL